ncbi:hypothetical protein [Actinoallomurus sp. CA-150999]|uniref:hypothetical protein n=1 Tax=Actinoallomurus sp. CA-150999 TaxID=3239887 RepID=UPI003D94A8F9
MGSVLVDAVTMWAESTLLSTSGFVAAVRPLPTDPAVETQIIDNAQRQLIAALDRSPARIGPRLLITAQVRQVMAGAVPAVLGSAAFQQAWKAALSTGHAELVAVLRHHNTLLTLTPNGLDLTVNIALAQMIDQAGPPHQLASGLPADLPVSVTLIQNQDLHYAAQAVRLSDELSEVLTPAIATLGFVGLLLARRRGRALIAGFAAAAIAAGAARLLIAWGQSYGSRPIIADVAARHLVAPLTTDLVTIAVACALASAGLIAARWVVARRGPR